MMKNQFSEFRHSIILAFMDILLRRQIIRKIRLKKIEGFKDLQEILYRVIRPSLLEILQDLDENTELQDRFELHLIFNFLENCLSDQSFLRLFESEEDWEKVSYYTKALFYIAEINFSNKYNLRNPRLVLADLLRMGIDSSNYEYTSLSIWEESKLFEKRALIFPFLRKKIANLPEGHMKKVLEMWIKGFTVRKTAIETGLNESTILLYKHQGFTYLRELLMIFLGEGL